MENNTTPVYEVSYLFLKSYGWVPKKRTVYGDQNLRTEIARLTLGVLRGDRIISRISKTN